MKAEVNIYEFKSTYLEMVVSDKEPHAAMLADHSLLSANTHISQHETLMVLWG